MKRAALVGAVVLANAMVQALCVAPGVTPAASPAFLGLLAASVVALVAAATALIALVGTIGGRRPRVLRALAAVVVSIVVVGALAIVSPATLVPSLLVALVSASPAGNAQATTLSGPRAFARHPTRAVLLAVLTVLALVVLSTAAVLFGFFVTGWAGALATWAFGGAIAAVLVHAWARLAARPRGSRRGTSQDERIRPGAVAR